MNTLSLLLTVYLTPFRVPVLLVRSQMRQKYTKLQVPNGVFLVHHLALVFEKEKGIFKKERELVEIVALDTVKTYNDAAQIKQKGDTVEVQTVSANIALTFSGMLEARKFAGKMVDAVTGTTLAQRSSEKIKGAFGMVDDTLGLDTRGAIKGILENGVKGTILNGIGKKK